MEISNLLGITESFAVVLISYVLLFILLYAVRFLRKNNDDKIKKYTFEFCNADKTNYTELFSKVENEHFERNNLQLELFDVLIHFEKIAIAVKNNIFDERIIRDYYARYFILYYKISKYKILLEYRNSTNDPFVFIEFEKLSNKWMGDNEWENRHV